MTYSTIRFYVEYTKLLIAFTVASHRSTIKFIIWIKPSIWLNEEKLVLPRRRYVCFLCHSEVSILACLPCAHTVLSTPALLRSHLFIFHKMNSFLWRDSCNHIYTVCRWFPSISPRQPRSCLRNSKLSTPTQPSEVDSTQRIPMWTTPPDRTPVTTLTGTHLQKHLIFLSHIWGGYHFSS